MSTTDVIDDITTTDRLNLLAIEEGRYRLGLTTETVSPLSVHLPGQGFDRADDALVEATRVLTGEGLSHPSGYATLAVVRAALRRFGLRTLAQESPA